MSESSSDITPEISPINSPLTKPYLSILSTFHPIKPKKSRLLEIKSGIQEKIKHKKKKLSNNSNRSNNKKSRSNSNSKKRSNSKKSRSNKPKKSKSTISVNISKKENVSVEIPDKLKMLEEKVNNLSKIVESINVNNTDNKISIKVDDYDKVNSKNYNEVNSKNYNEVNSKNYNEVNSKNYNEVNSNKQFTEIPKVPQIILQEEMIDELVEELIEELPKKLQKKPPKDSEYLPEETLKESEETSKDLEKLPEETSKESAEDLTEESEELPDLNVYIVKDESDITIKEEIMDSELSDEVKLMVLQKLKNSSASDYSKTLQWTNSLLKIPFNKMTKLPIKKEHGKKSITKYLNNRMKILNKSVYGLVNVKEEIIEFIGKMIRNPESKGNVIALKGPPGVGKTKIIKSGISEALNRSFSVINFGGLKDSSLLDGHDQTYIGSKYGRIVQILINAKTMDPVIYLDEVDKISESHINEISGILTHLLDEEQNNEFYDHYFQGIPIDLSKVLFVISFNEISKINNIVSDRMKIIEIDPPSVKDKVQIAKRYILPEVLSNFNLEANCIELSENTIQYIINNKTIKEHGVRKLKKNIFTIVQKISLIELLGVSNKKENKLTLSYQKEPIKTVKFPVTVTNEIVDILLIDKKENMNFMYT